MKQIEINNKKFEMYISDKEIQEIVKELAVRISNDYREKDVLFIVVLKGSIFFASDLLREIPFNTSIEFLKASSYGNSMNSSGNVDLNSNLPDLHGKDILVIEDIVDTGNTIFALRKLLLKDNPKSVEVVALLSKPSQRQVEVEIKYVGKEIPPEFVVGYGMDYAQQGRNLKSIYSSVK